MTASEVLDAVEELVINAGLEIPVRTSNAPEGYWTVSGELEAMPEDGSGSWASIRMPFIPSRQFTSGRAEALRGAGRPVPLAYIRYFCPLGTGAAQAYAAVEAVAAVLEGEAVSDANGGVHFEEGVSIRELGDGLASPTGEALYHQVEGVIYGTYLTRKAVA